MISLLFIIYYKKQYVINLNCMVLYLFHYKFYWLLLHKFFLYNNFILESEQIFTNIQFLRADNKNLFKLYFSFYYLQAIKQHICSEIN